MSALLQTRAVMSLALVLNRTTPVHVTKATGHNGNDLCPSPVVIMPNDFVCCDCELEFSRI